MLMKQHAVASESASASQNTEFRKPFKCDQCNFSSDSKRGLKVHIGKAHRGPEEIHRILARITQFLQTTPKQQLMTKKTSRKTKHDTIAGSRSAPNCPVLNLSVNSILMSEIFMNNEEQLLLLLWSTRDPYNTGPCMTCSCCSSLPFHVWCMCKWEIYIYMMICPPWTSCNDGSITSLSSPFLPSSSRWSSQCQLLHLNLSGSFLLPAMWSPPRGPT